MNRDDRSALQTPAAAPGDGAPGPEDPGGRDRPAKAGRTAAGTSRLARQLRRVMVAREAGLAAVVILLVVVLSWRSPYFLTTSNLTVVGRQIALALLVAIGMTFVILAGQIDLSVGSTVALVSILTGEFMVSAGITPVVAIGLALTAGVLVGLVNGGITAYSGIPSFVVTLGMLAVARGLALGITQGQTISGFPAEFLFIGQGFVAGIPVPVLVAVVVAVLAHLVLSRTVFGRHVYFLGSNEEAATLSGIRVRRVKIAVFTIAAGLAALDAVIETARLSVGQPAAGNGYELLAIGAVVIGGANLFGGEGSILGTVLGTVLLGLIQNGLILLNISAYWQQVFSGAIIVGAVGLNVWRRRQQR